MNIGAKRILLSENIFAGHWETVVDCMKNIEKRQQLLILPKNCRRTQLWFNQNIRSSIQIIPMTAPSGGSLWYLQWATVDNNEQQWKTMDNNVQQSAVLHASMMPFLTQIYPPEYINLCAFYWLLQVVFTHFLFKIGGGGQFWQCQHFERACNSNSFLREIIVTLWHWSVSKLLCHL